MCRERLLQTLKIAAPRGTATLGLGECCAEEMRENGVVWHRCARYERACGQAEE